MKLQDATGETAGLSRRQFLASAAAAGAGLVLARPVFAQQANLNSALQVAFIGVGSQGANLLNNCLKIDGVRIIAICDIWQYQRERFSKIMEKYNQPVNVYEDYQEMLASEPGIDAVIVATPDFCHAQQTNDCLRAGKHVYCEKEMARTLEEAASMVRTQRETGKLLQIGHQRRSNPRYGHALKLIENDKILGRITHFNGQWNRPVAEPYDWPKGSEIPEETLARYGFKNMHEYRNWRWYKAYGSGPFADLGSHQLDVFNWFLKTTPASVMASGGIDYYTDGREWYDNVLAIYTYETPAGLVRGVYNVYNTTGHGGFFETFMGDEGSMVISEDERKGYFFREVHAKKREWEEQSETVDKGGEEAFELKIGETLAPDGSPEPEGQKLLEESKKPVHQLHLENFFKAVRGEEELNCPPEIGYETAVTVLRVNDAVASGGTLTFAPEDFTVA
ncbi:MAG TPA: Gfo/Idh/MocA family oxidoreductase [Candidatus Sumerlaeota bacterium]|nr:Gfo/Idh/MocA family oxidoreductase [Candidatus Sumerlaeota bacterium]HOR26393.1 Gfo/Idh/MocA family oxidoreductase [Candidatus Sumerlaeota bacterium]HPK03881.1 Gfo/Idh/MocA family oxidoreductase [Candidatus Sumerlaeota bacterium]